MSFHFAVRLTDLPKGCIRPVRLDDMHLLFARTEDDVVFAVENRCSHDGGGFDDGRLANRTLTCPRHGATFDIATGKALTMPAVAPIETFPIRIQGDSVEVELEDDE